MNFPRVASDSSWITTWTWSETWTATWKPTHSGANECARASTTLPTLSEPNAFPSSKTSTTNSIDPTSNINVVDVKANPILRFEAGGIRQEDSTFHKLDVIALATGFDSITGEIKDIVIKGLDGEILTEKWKMGTWTYLGMTTARFPNFFFTYGPQAPTAFANGPSCAELQGDWLVELLEQMREQGKSRIDATGEAEAEWKVLVNELASWAWGVIPIRGIMEGIFPGSRRRRWFMLGAFLCISRHLKHWRRRGIPSPARNRRSKMLSNKNRHVLGLRGLAYRCLEQPL
jgi:hypothetical protein